MKRLAALGLLCISQALYADTTYLGLYMKGNKIGYSSYQSMATVVGTEAVTRSDSKTVLDAGLLGSEMSVSLTSTSWISKSGRPIRMTFDTESGGRSNKVEAIFGPASVTLDIVNGGIKTRRTLPLPTGGKVVDDPLSLVLSGEMHVGTTRTVYVLDPSTASFMKNSVLFLGPTKIAVGGKPVSARLIRMADPTSTTDVYIDKKGDVLRVNAAMGMVMLPLSRELALSRPGKYRQSTDLAISTSIRADKAIQDPEDLSCLKLKLLSDSIREIPSDQFQSVSRVGKAWIVDIHPPRLAKHPAGTIAVAALSKPEWLKPSLNIPSDSLRFKELATKIIGSKRDVQSASFAIQLYVYQNMRFNSGIGVLRDATEVLDTKEGVCRDFAILTLTLLRSAGIPARLASGLVNSDGAFYYHAWTEAWDGTRWIGVDSVTDRAQISASHVKLGEGNVDTAFSFAFLEKAKIEVLDARKD